MIMALIFLSFAAVAAENSSKPAPGREAMTQRHEKMAEMHRKTAECLKAGKSVESCREAMKKDMPAAGECVFMGDGCPMRGPRGGRGKGMRMGRPGPKPAPSKEEPEPTVGD